MSSPPRAPSGHLGVNSERSPNVLDPTAPFDPYEHLYSKRNTLGIFGNAMFVIVGWSTWLLTSGIFTEVNHLQCVLPEKDQLFADSDFSLEMGNVIPAILVLYFGRTILKAHFRKVVAVVLVGNVITCICMALFYKTTLGGSSVVFLATCFFAGACGATSMVSFFAFASEYGPSAVASLSTGIGMTGLIALLDGIAQRLNTPPVAFSSTIYFLILVAVLAVSLGAYFLIVTRFERARRDTALMSLLGNSSMLEADSMDEIILYEEQSNESERSLGGYDGIDSNSTRKNKRSACFTRVVLAFFHTPVEGFKRVVLERPSPFLAIYLSCVTEFGIPAILPYFIPCVYRNNGMSFWMTFCFLTGSIGGRILTAVRSYRNFAILQMVQTMFFAYLVIVASLQTNIHDRYVVPLPVSLTCMFMLSFTHGYIVTEVFQSVSDSTEMSSWAGLINQAGALTGSFLLFIIVHIGVFDGKSKCPQKGGC